MYSRSYIFSQYTVNPNSTLQYLEGLISICHCILPLLVPYAAILLGEKKVIGVQFVSSRYSLYRGVLYNNCH